MGAILLMEGPKAETVRACTTEGEFTLTYERPIEEGKPEKITERKKVTVQAYLDADLDAGAKSAFAKEFERLHIPISSVECTTTDVENNMKCVGDFTEGKITPGVAASAAGGSRLKRKSVRMQGDSPPTKRASIMKGSPARARDAVQNDIDAAQRELEEKADLRLYTEMGPIAARLEELKAELERAPRDRADIVGDLSSVEDELKEAAQKGDTAAISEHMKQLEDLRAELATLPRDRRQIEADIDAAEKELQAKAQKGLYAELPPIAARLEELKSELATAPRGTAQIREELKKAEARLQEACEAMETAAIQEWSTAVNDLQTELKSCGGRTDTGVADEPTAPVPSFVTNLPLYPASSASSSSSAMKKEKAAPKKRGKK
jgi:hypothetical protein